MTESGAQTAAAPAKRGNPWGVTAFVLGLIGLIFGLIPVVGMVTFGLGPLALIFGIIGLVSKNRTRGLAIAGVVTGAIGLIIAIIFTQAVYSAFSSDDASEAETVDQDETAESGSFEFTVTDVDDDVDKVGPSQMAETPDGKYVVVSVETKNVGDEAETFWGGEQKLLDEDDTKYSTDDDAAVVMEDSNQLLNEINPGNTADGKLVFDVPEKVTPEYVLFSGGPFDDAVKVHLT